MATVKVFLTSGTSWAGATTNGVLGTTIDELLKDESQTPGPAVKKTTGPKKPAVTKGKTS